MVERELTIVPSAPVYLVGANHQPEWRVPGLKALLRQWWRIAAAKGCGYDHKKLRKAEGELFGHAFLKNERGKISATKSRIGLRLDHWNLGQLEGRYPRTLVEHPEVDRNRQIDAHQYLGYGALRFREEKRGTWVDRKPLPIGSQQKLHLDYPGSYLPAEVETALQLVHLFGATGSRSRNGWGSLLIGDNEQQAWPGLGDNAQWKLLEACTLRLEECLKKTWPHAFGRDDDGPLVWCTAPQAEFSGVIRDLAIAKIAFRTTTSIGANRRGNPEFADRHVLALPVTRHDIRQNHIRWASQLRFKITRSADKFVGVAFHLPCGLPPSLDRERDPSAQLEIWQAVHRVLDDKMTRVGSPEVAARVGLAQTSFPPLQDKLRRPGQQGGDRPRGNQQRGRGDGRGHRAERHRGAPDPTPPPYKPKA